MLDTDGYQEIDETPCLLTSVLRAWRRLFHALLTQRLLQRLSLLDCLRSMIFIFDSGRVALRHIQTLTATTWVGFFSR